MNRHTAPVPMIEELAAGYVPAFDPAFLSSGEGQAMRALVIAPLLVWLAVVALAPSAPASSDPPVAAPAVKDLADADKNASAVPDSTLREEFAKEWY